MAVRMEFIRRGAEEDLMICTLDGTYGSHFYLVYVLYHHK